MRRYYREENPVGNWTLNVYDVDNPESTGFMLNWTLTLFGEQDPNFVGEPIHLSTSIHEEKEHEVTISTTSAAKTTTSDNTPSRPTRVKPEKSSSITKTKDKITSTSVIPTSTSSSAAIPSSDSTHENESLDTQTNSEEQQVKEDTGYLTIIYSVIGSVAIFAIASLIFVFKRNGWKSPYNTSSEPDRIPDGYEFDALQPLTELDEEDESESDNEVDRLVRNNNH